MSVSINNLHIEYPEQLVFQDVSLDVADNELVVIHSNVLDGGTSLLKGIAGFLHGVGGQVGFEGVDLLSSPPASIYQRIGFVYESGGLLSIYTVLQNICLPLQFHAMMSMPAILREVTTVCQLLGIDESVLSLKPHDLNDVQTRMINLARALVMRPSLLLIDELEGGMSEQYLADTMAVIRQRQQAFPMAIIITTASELIMAQADQVYRINNQQLEFVNE